MAEVILSPALNGTAVLGVVMIETGPGSLMVALEHADDRITPRCFDNAPDQAVDYAIRMAERFKLPGIEAHGAAAELMEKRLGHPPRMIPS